MRNFRLGQIRAKHAIEKCMKCMLISYSHISISEETFRVLRESIFLFNFLKSIILRVANC